MPATEYKNFEEEKNEQLVSSSFDKVGSIKGDTTPNNMIAR